MAVNASATYSRPPLAGKLPSDWWLKFGAPLPRGVLLRDRSTGLNGLGVLTEDHSGDRTDGVVKYRSFATTDIHTDRKDEIVFLPYGKLVTNKSVLLRAEALSVYVAVFATEDDYTQQPVDMEPVDARVPLPAGIILTSVPQTSNRGMGELTASLHQLADPFGTGWGSVLSGAYPFGFVIDDFELTKASTEAVPAVALAINKLVSRHPDKYSRDSKVLQLYTRNAPSNLGPLPPWPDDAIPGDIVLARVGEEILSGRLLAVDIEGFVVEFGEPVGGHSYDGMGKSRHCLIVSPESVVKRL